MKGAMCNFQQLWTSLLCSQDGWIWIDLAVEPTLKSAHLHLMLYTTFWPNPKGQGPLPMWVMGGLSGSEEGGRDLVMPVPGQVSQEETFPAPVARGEHFQPSISTSAWPFCLKHTTFSKSASDFHQQPAQILTSGWHLIPEIMFCVSKRGNTGTQSLVRGPWSYRRDANRPWVTGNFQSHRQHLLRSHRFLIIWIRKLRQSQTAFPCLQPSSPTAILQGFKVPSELPSSDPVLWLLLVSPGSAQTRHGGC